MTSQSGARIVKCPTCKAEVVFDAEISPHRPFCSERCRLIDLGAWASEKYQIPSTESLIPPTEADDDEPIH